MNPHNEELACLYVLDQLEPRERAVFEGSLLNDPELRVLVSELESALERRLHALPRLEPPVGLLAQIEARLDRLLAAGPSRTVRPPAALWPSVARWGIAALFAIGLLMLALEYRWRVQAAAERPFVIMARLDSRRSTLAELPMKRRPADSDASFIQLASLAEKYWEKPGDLPATPRATGDAGRGYALFDPATNEGFIAIQQLPVIDPGQRYHLWILDTASGQVREAGVLPLAGSNRGLFFFSVAPAGEARSSRLDFFVTAEDSAASVASRPKGRIVLGDRTTF